MKTLKKSLALVLAVVMVVGVLAVSASAATYTDSDKIEYTEAVEVLSAIGVIGGIGDGSFAPTATLTREQGAAIVIRALLTRSVSDGLGATSAAVSDVPANWWSAGVVEYAAQQGIINGIGDGSFAPNAELTGAQFAKMLLVAIGVDGEFTGGAWYNNTIIAATKAGLADGITGFDYSKGITREEACQMAWNAIQYSVNGKTTTYVVTVGDDVVYSGTNEETANLIAGLRAGAKLTEKESSKGSIADKTYGLSRDTSVDAFGRPTVVVTDGKDNGVKVVISGDEAIATYTTEVNLVTVATKLGATTSKAITFNVFDNSKTSTEVSVKKGDADNKIGGDGTLVEIYKTAKDTYSVIVVDTYVAELAEGDITEAKAATATADAVEASITIAGMTYKTDAFKKGDVVLYTVADGEIQNVVKAASITGSVTAKASTYVRIDGVKYVTSANSGLTIGEATDLLDLTDDVNTYYLDTYGNIIYTKAGETAKVEDSYIYVIQTAEKSKDTTSEGDNLFESITSGSAAAQAQVIDLETGEVSVVNQAIVKNTAGKYVYADVTGAASEKLVGDTGIAAVGKIYTYVTLEDGSIVLRGEATTKDVTVEKNKANIGVADVVATSSTKLTVVEYTTDKDGKVVSATSTTSTGIANFPTKATAYNALVVSSKGVVNSIVVVKEKGVVSTGITYAIFNGEGETTSTGTAVSFYVDGSEVQYTLAKGANVDGLKKGDVVSIKITDGKLETPTTEDVKVAATGKVTVVDDSFIVVGGTVCYFAKTSTTVDAGDSYKTATVAVGDTVTVYGTVDAADFIVIAK